MLTYLWNGLKKSLFILDTEICLQVLAQLDLGLIRQSEQLLKLFNTFRNKLSYLYVIF